MKSSEKERIVWFLHPYRTMTVQTAKQVYIFKLQGFQIEFHSTFIKLYLVFDIGKVRHFKNLFPIFEENLRELRTEELVDVIHTPDETQGLVIKIPANIDNFKFSPISVVSKIFNDIWRIEDVPIPDDHRYAKLFHSLAPSHPSKKKLSQTDLRIN